MTQDKQEESGVTGETVAHHKLGRVRGTAAGAEGLGAGMTPGCAQGLDVAGQLEEMGATASTLQLPGSNASQNPAVGSGSSGWPWIIAEGPAPENEELAWAGSSSAGAQPGWQSPPPASLGSLIAAQADLWPFSLLSNLRKELDYNLELFQLHAGDCRRPVPQKRPRVVVTPPLQTAWAFLHLCLRFLHGVAMPQFPSWAWLCLSFPLRVVREELRFTPRSIFCPPACCRSFSISVLRGER